MVAIFCGMWSENLWCTYVPLHKQVSTQPLNVRRSTYGVVLEHEKVRIDWNDLHMKDASWRTFDPKLYVLLKRLIKNCILQRKIRACIYSSRRPKVERWKHYLSSRHCDPTRRLHEWCKCHGPMWRAPWLLFRLRVLECLLDLGPTLRHHQYLVHTQNPQRWVARITTRILGLVWSEN